VRERGDGQADQQADAQVHHGGSGGITAPTERIADSSVITRSRNR
jgi:hypothetical protein